MDRAAVSPRPPPPRYHGLTWAWAGWAPRQPAGAAGRLRGLETLARLAGRLPPSGTALAVDAETASRLLSVTPRTARRLLHALVDEGLAWPLPPSRAPQPGRPRQFYRLLVEKLERRPPP